MLRGLVRTARPGQWTKNLLVVAAPLAAGTLLHGEVAGRTAIAFGTFCLASSAVYCVNDVCDREADRQHPVKRHRPVAAGTVSPRAAIALAVVLAAVALVAGGPNPLRLVLASYLAVSIGYSLGLKHEPVLELALVASGFLLRAVAGGPATGTPLSEWFLIVSGFGSLVIVTGKRMSEMALHGAETLSRPMLAGYTDSFLRLVFGIATAVTMSAYGLWAFDGHAASNGSVWSAVSVAPFVVAVLRYAWHVDRGEAEDPARVLRSDRVMQLLVLAWVGCFAVSVLRG